LSANLTDGPRLRRAAGSRSAPCRSLLVDHHVALRAETFDLHLHHIAGLEVAGWFGAMADAGRRARRDQISHPERHEATHVGDELPPREAHVLRVAVLAPLAVDVGPEPEPLRVGDLVGGHEPRADGRERVRALSLGRAAAMLHLECALRD